MARSGSAGAGDLPRRASPMGPPPARPSAPASAPSTATWRRRPSLARAANTSTCARVAAAWSRRREAIGGSPTQDARGCGRHGAGRPRGGSRSCRRVWADGRALAATERTSLQGQNEHLGASWDIVAQDAFTISRALAGKGAGRGGAMHRRTIAVLDLVNGKITDRASDTLTLDVPADFDRTAGVATVDARSRHYL